MSSKIDLRRYRSFSQSRLVLDSFLLWGTIFLSIYAACQYGSFWIYFLAYVIIGTRQLALSHMVHTASHYHFFPDNKWLNDLIGDIFFATPVLISTASYRAQHNPHHRYTSISEKDTDARAWYNIKGYNFVLRVIYTICGVEALKTIFSYTAPKNKPASKSIFIRYAFLVMVTNAIVGLFCYFAGNIWAYFLLWLLPLFTITPLLITLRVIAEHQSVEYAALGLNSPHQSFAPPLTRTINGGVIGRFILGSLNFCYHHEHHLYPGINYQQLPALHNDLMKGGYYQINSDALSKSYGSTLLQLIFPKKATQ